MHELADEVPFEVGGVRFTPIPVDHLVPTYGFLIEHNGAKLLWSSDTGPTQRLWEIAIQTTDLKGIWIDTSFDNALQPIADLSLHLTSQTVASELRKLKKRVPVLLHHLKPTCRQKIYEQVKALQNPDLDFLEQGKTYQF